MLKPPKVGGAEQLRLFVDELGMDWACKVIATHPTTMRRWLRGATPVPVAVLMALYWLTTYGYSDACAEAHWSHQWLAYKVRELEGRLEAIREKPKESAQIVQPAVGFPDSLGRVLGALMQRGQVGPDGGIAAKSGTDGQDEVQEEFRREGHFLSASTMAGATFSTDLPTV